MGHDDIVKLLIDNGASVNALADGQISALMLASMNGHANTVKFLLNNGAKVNIRHNKGFTALSLAKKQDVIKLLKEAGAQ